MNNKECLSAAGESPASFNPDNRKHYSFLISTEHGRSQCKITCPFCGCKIIAYLWSLAGSGKLCPTCKAKHVMGLSIRKIKGSANFNINQQTHGGRSVSQPAQNCEDATSPC